jgi:hypothetical protein
MNNRVTNFNQIPKSWWYIFVAHYQFNINLKSIDTIDASYYTQMKQIPIYLLTYANGSRKSNWNLTEEVHSNEKSYEGNQNRNLTLASLWSILMATRNPNKAKLKLWFSAIREERRESVEDWGRRWMKLRNWESIALRVILVKWKQKN